MLKTFAKLGILLLTVTALSCEKSTEFNPNDKSATEDNSKDSKINASNLKLENKANPSSEIEESEHINYSISKEDFNNELSLLTDPDFNSKFLKNNPGARLYLQLAKDNARINFKITPRKGSDKMNMTEELTIICQGSGGYTFAKYVGDWIDENPEGCVIVNETPPGSGSYTAWGMTSGCP